MSLLLHALEHIIQFDLVHTLQAIIFETFQWLTMLSLSLRELTIENLLWDAVIVHPDDMLHPSYLVFQDYGFNVSSCDLKGCDPILPFDGQDIAHFMLYLTNKQL